MGGGGAEDSEPYPPGRERHRKFLTLKMKGWVADMYYLARQVRISREQHKGAPVGSGHQGGRRGKPGTTIFHNKVYNCLTF